MSCAVRLMPAKVLFSDASRSTRPLRDAMRFSSARDQAEETRRRHNAAARRALCRQTLISANNYANSLIELRRFDQAKSLLRKSIRVARRFLGENTETALKMSWYYAGALYDDPAATLDNLREAVSTLEETERTARRVLGGAHPFTKGAECELRKSRAALRARGAP